MAHCTLKRFNDAPLYLLLNLPFSNKKISCTNACRLSFMIIPYMWDLVMTDWLWLVALCLKTQFWGWSYNTLIHPYPYQYLMTTPLSNTSNPIKRYHRFGETDMEMGQPDWNRAIGMLEAESTTWATSPDLNPIEKLWSCLSDRVWQCKSPPQT